MKKVTAVLLLLCCNYVCIGACSTTTKEFYRSYLNNFLQDDSKNVVLCEIYLTEELIYKVDRLTSATGADPIIRGQDATKDAIETLSVEELGDDWYLVKYLFRKGDKNTLVEIPLKAQNVNGKCKITYITPIWNDSQYGDKLLTCQGKGSNKIDQTSELQFIKSFYNAYISQYCAMPKDLSSKLSSLRQHYLSPAALAQFKSAESENLKDGLAGYDMLIDNFDFDCLWYWSLEITHLNGSNYQITYNTGNQIHKTVITIKKQGNNYLIDRL